MIYKLYAFVLRIYELPQATDNTLFDHVGFKPHVPSCQLVR